MQAGIVNRLDDRLHHQSTIRRRVALGPIDGEPIVVEVLAAFLEVREILVGQVLKVSAHVLLRQLNEVHAGAIAHTTRARVQHEPYIVGFIEADFDEMVPRRVPELSPFEIAHKSAA